MAPPVAPPSIEPEPPSPPDQAGNAERPVSTTINPRRLKSVGAAAIEGSAAESAEKPASPPSAAPNAGNATSATSANLIRIEGELRRCTTDKALWHHLANEPVALLPFGQALVVVADTSAPSAWFRRAAAGNDATAARWKAVAVSGLANVNRDAPMTRWYEHMVDAVWREHNSTRAIHIFDLPAYADADDPCTEEAALQHLMWVPLVDGNQPVKAGWLLARDTPWEDVHQKLAARLANAYAHGLSAIEGRTKPPAAWRRHLGKLYLALGAAALALIFIRVPLTTLAPAEVTPQSPLVMAAPVPGVVERILVPPGAQVSKGTPLVKLVDTQLRSDFDVATQKLEVARAKMLRLQQASVEDDTAKRELAIARSEEGVAQAERDYAKAMLDKSVLHATQAGVALYGDPRDWVGRPVAVGEAIMRVADPKQVEFRIKVPVSDAVNLQKDARVKIFLDAAPLNPVEARVMRAAYKAETDAAGVASYTVTARVTDPNVPPERLGLRGTARIYGEPVSLLYYLLRRPITAARQWAGI